LCTDLSPRCVRAGGRFRELKSVEEEAVPKGVRLAAKWFSNFGVEDEFREDGADELAWELRYLFDAIQNSPTIFDPLSEAVPKSKDSLVFRKFSSRVLKKCESLPDPVATNLLRHFAQCILKLVETSPALAGLSNRFSEKLSKSADLDRRIDLRNVAEVYQRLRTAFQKL
jgi:hypothetical protein